MPIHRLRLDNPRRKILLPQGPENRNERYRNQDVEQDFAGFLVENLTPIRSQADGRDVDELLAAGPKENRRDHHEDTGQAECDVRTVKARTFEKANHRRRKFGDKTIRRGFVRFQQKRNQKRRERRASVDRKIKPVKEPSKKMLVRLAKLSSAVVENTWLSPAAALSDQTKADR